MFRARVLRKRSKPRVNAAKVVVLSNSCTPVSRVTICVLIAVTARKGLKVRGAAKLAAMATIMVSPIALERAKRIAPAIPGAAAGRTTFIMVSLCVAPRAYEPSRKVCGTVLIASSEREEIKGVIMIPTTEPTASALSDEIDRPSMAPILCTAGAITNMAKKP